MVLAAERVEPLPFLPGAQTGETEVDARIALALDEGDERAAHRIADVRLAALVDIVDRVIGVVLLRAQARRKVRRNRQVHHIIAGCHIGEVIDTDRIGHRGGQRRVHTRDLLRRFVEFDREAGQAGLPGVG